VPRPLPGAVKALGAVSLLTDVSSEMIYPLLPAFVTGTLRAGPALLGVIEGLAETTASLVKLGSGRLSDRLPRRKPLVVAGYSLSSLARPLVGFALAPWHVLLVRLADRVGKGTRGAPRDAIVAEVVAPDERGRAYGFHRAMDNAGACLGPLLASVLLALGCELRAVFWAAALPGLVSLCVLIAGVSEPTRPPGAAPRPRSDGRGSMASLAPYLVVLALFTLGNSSDAFLLLRAQQAGVGLGLIPLMWMLHNGVKAATSTPLGALSDRFGRRRTIALGWGVYALAYAGFAFASGATQVTLVFAFYALFHALSEGPERALVADLAGAARSGAAFGAYHAVTGVMLLPASVLTGWLWQRFGATTALMTGAGLAAVAAAGLLLFVSERVGS
jgi:MFS family permease